jgi:hypothetical protein
MQTMQEAIRSVFFTLSALVLTMPALATTVTEQTFPDLVHQAEVITVGTVTGIQEQWDASRQVPMTQVTFSHLTMLKGDPDLNSLTLEFLGGHLPDGRVLTISGMPHFTMGEKAVVFSAGNQQYFWPLVGGWQGLFRITFDSQRGEEVVSDNFSVPIAGVQNGQFLKLLPEVSGHKALSLSTFIDLIKQEMGSAYGQ